MGICYDKNYNFSFGKASGSSTIDGRAKDMAKEIADVLQVKFKEQGWI